MDTSRFASISLLLDWGTTAIERMPCPFQALLSPLAVGQAPTIKQLLLTLSELAKNTICFEDNATKPRPKHPKPHLKTRI
jgi:hypothetical protein